MAINKSMEHTVEWKSSSSVSTVVSLALVSQLSARIARREGRMKHRVLDRWARQDETKAPSAA